MKYKIIMVLSYIAAFPVYASETPYRPDENSNRTEKTGIPFIDEKNKTEEININNKETEVEDFSFSAEEHFESGTGLTGKITTEYSSFKVSVLDFRESPDKVKKDKTAICFYSPVVSVGRIKKKGLYKELENPSFWYAGSETYTDTPSFSEDLSLNRNGKYGFILQPSDSATLYALADEDDSFRITEKGGGLSIKLNSLFNVHAVYTESLRQETASDDWYDNRNTEYGESIRHSAVLLERDGEVFSSSLSAGASFGKCFKTGKYFRYQPEIQIGPLTLYLLVSLSDSFYRRTKKGYPSVKLRRGIKAEYELNRFLEAESGYNRDIYHSDCLSEIENRMGEILFFKIKYDVDLYFLILEAERKNKVESFKYINEDTFSAKTGMRGKIFSFSVKPAFKYSCYEALSRSIVISTSATDGMRKIALNHKIDRGERLNCLTRGRLSIDIAKTSFYTEAEYETLDEDGVNIKSVLRFSAGSRFRY